MILRACIERQRSCKRSPSGCKCMTSSSQKPSNNRSNLQLAQTCHELIVQQHAFLWRREFVPTQTRSTCFLARRFFLPTLFQLRLTLVQLTFDAFETAKEKFRSNFEDKTKTHRNICCCSARFVLSFSFFITAAFCRASRRRAFFRRGFFFSDCIVAFSASFSCKCTLNHVKTPRTNYK